MDKDVNDFDYIVLPSEVHTFVYCPRYFFFERFLTRRLTLRERLRLFMGRLFHLIKGLSDKIRGYNVESTIYTVIGKVMITGRPDSFKVDNDRAEIIERKSGRGPREGAWLSDIAQASTYALVLSRTNEQIRETKIVIEYRNRKVVLPFDSNLVNLVLRVIDDIILVKYYGVLPVALRGRRCEKCPFRELCSLLDEDPEVSRVKEELLEPGAWLAQMNIISRKEKVS